MPDLQLLAAEARRELVGIESVPSPGPGHRLAIAVREPAGFATGRIPGAVDIPRGLLEPEVARHVADGRGPARVHPIAGGIMGWAAAGRTVAMPVDPPSAT